MLFDYKPAPCYVGVGMKNGGRAKFVSLFAVALIALTWLFAPFGSIVSACSSSDLQCLLNQQNSLQAQQAQVNKQLSQTKSSINNLQDAIGSIDSSITYTTNQIDNTQSQIQVTDAIIADLDSSIQTTQAQLDDLNSRLKTAYANLYELSQTSTIEMILQSNSLNDMLSQSQYIESIQTDLQGNIDEANKLQADLLSKKQSNESQKASLKALNDQLSQSVSSLSTQRNQKNQLLSQTQGQEAQYATLLQSLKSDISTVNNQIIQIYEEAARNSSGIVASGTGGYPYANWAQDLPDPWSFLTRECTSYVAWKWNNVYGYSWNRNPLPNGVPSGNAQYWATIARSRGFTVSSTPIARSIAVWSGGTYGHVAVVEQVLGGGSFQVSEYNFSPPFGGKYDTRITSTANGGMGTPLFIYPPGM